MAHRSPPIPSGRATATAAVPGPTYRKRTERMFRRSSIRYGQTPEPVTPHQRAAQIWDDRIGSARVQARNWRLAFFGRSEEHTSELQSLMRISYAVFCLKKKKNK